MDQETFKSLYKTTVGMRCAPAENATHEQVFRAMLIAWSIENGFKPDQSILSHDDQVLLNNYILPADDDMLSAFAKS